MRSLLTEFDYFTRVTANGVPLALEEPGGLTLGVRDGQLTIGFALPVAGAPPGTIAIDVFDIDFAYAFNWAPPGLTTSGAPPECVVRMREAADPPVLTGMEAVPGVDSAADYPVRIVVSC